MYAKHDSKTFASCRQDMGKDTLISLFPMKNSFIMILLDERKCFEAASSCLWRSWVAGCFNHPLALVILVSKCKAMSVL